MEYMRTMLSAFISPQASRKTIFPLRAISPDAPARRPWSTCWRITMLILFSLSGANPSRSGAAVGKPAEQAKEAHRAMTNRGLVMTQDFSCWGGHTSTVPREPPVDARIHGLTVLRNLRAGRKHR